MPTTKAPASDTTEAMQTRFLDGLTSFANVLAKTAPKSSPFTKGSPSLRAKKGIHTRRNKYGEKAMSSQSLESLRNLRKQRNQSNEPISE